MNRIPVFLALLAAACGSVNERAECSRHVDCPQGQYCAPTPDGNVCWADEAAPQVTSVTAACDGGCRRDSVLRVTAAISDATSEVLDASVALDLPGGPAAMTRSGTQWVADVDLRSYAFEHFERSVVATVTARDGARNASAPTAAAGVGVTRLRWTYDAGAPVTAPAVMADGTLIVGVSATSDQLLAVRADGTKAWSRTVGGTAFVTAAPAIGDHAIWVGSEDFSLYAVELDGSAVKAGVGVATGGAIRGSVAVLPAGTKEWGFAASAAGVVGAASTVPSEDVTAIGAVAFSSGPAIGNGQRVYAATATGTATLRAYGFGTSPVNSLTNAWSVPVGANVSAPLALDAAGDVWTGTLDRVLSKTIPGEASGTVTTIATLPGSIVDSPVILANGDVIVGDDTGLVHRFSSAGTQLWAAEPSLGAAAHSPMVLTDPETPFLVPSAGGKVFAIRGDGTVAWSGTLEAGRALRPPNIHTPAGGGPVLSTAYFTNAGGKIFAVIVDGQLDSSAPWPKAFHDPRNTNRAGPQP